MAGRLARSSPRLSAGGEYGATLEGPDRYFLALAMAAKKRPLNPARGVRYTPVPEQSVTAHEGSSRRTAKEIVEKLKAGPQRQGWIN